jgi:hypothetical protein
LGALARRGAAVGAVALDAGGVLSSGGFEVVSALGAAEAVALASAESIGATTGAAFVAGFSGSALFSRAAAGVAPETAGRGAALETAATDVDPEPRISQTTTMTTSARPTPSPVKTRTGLLRGETGNGAFVVPHPATDPLGPVRRSPVDCAGEPAGPSPALSEVLFAPLCEP